MINAYKIRTQLQDIEHYLEESGGEATEQILAMLREASESQEQRLKDLNSLLLRADAQLSLISEQEKRLDTEKKSIKRKIEALENEVGLLLDYACKWEDGTNALTWKRSEGIDIAEGTVLDPVYIRVKEVREPDKVLLTKDIKSGATIEGVSLKPKYTLKRK
jgi:predicted nuclease with TOPRIM domain